MDQTLEKTYRYGGFQEFCLSVHFFPQGKNDATYLVEKFFLFLFFCFLPQQEMKTIIHFQSTKDYIMTAYF